MRRFIVVSMGLLLFGFAFVNAQQIIHDAEYYILKAQHGEKWAQEDVGLNEKLAALKKKHGKTPNIIHIMWDDTAVGEIGVPQIQASRGFKTPNINKFAAEDINSNDLKLTVAGYNVNRVKSLVDGRVKIKGCSINFVQAGIGDMNSSTFCGEQAM